MGQFRRFDDWSASGVPRQSTLLFVDRSFGSFSVSNGSKGKTWSKSSNYWVAPSESWKCACRHGREKGSIDRIRRASDKFVWSLLDDESSVIPWLAVNCWIGPSASWPCSGNMLMLSLQNDSLLRFFGHMHSLKVQCSCIWICLFSCNIFA